MYDYIITEKARKSPILMQSPLYNEFIGIGGEYVQKQSTGSCASCGGGEKKPLPQPKIFREATEDEYQEICRITEKAGGLPSLILIRPKKAKKEATQDA